MNKSTIAFRMKTCQTKDNRYRQINKISLVMTKIHSSKSNKTILPLHRPLKYLNLIKNGRKYR